MDNLKKKNESLEKNSQNNKSFFDSTSTDGIESPIIQPQNSENEAPNLNRVRLNSPSLNWKLGSILVLGLVCSMTFLPTEFNKNISNVRKNSIVPMFNPVKITPKDNNINSLQRISDICKPYCNNYCKKSDEKFYTEEYYNDARKIHKVIPSLYANNASNNLKPNKSNKLNLKAHKKMALIQKDVIINDFNGIGINIEKEKIKTLICNSAIEVSDDFNVESDQGYEGGQLINLVIPKNKIQQISTDPKNDQIHTNESTGYLGIIAQVQNSKDLVKNI